MVHPAFNFNLFMEKERLATNGSNHQLGPQLEDSPTDDAPDEEKNVFLTRQEDHSLVHCGILYGLETELRKRFENSTAYDTMREFKMIFDCHAAVESYEASEKFFSCMME